jgi:hypothetical protein
VRRGGKKTFQLTASSPLPPTQPADVGLGRVVACAQKIR